MAPRGAQMKLPRACFFDVQPVRNSIRSSYYSSSITYRYTIAVCVALIVIRVLIPVYYLYLYLPLYYDPIQRFRLYYYDVYMNVYMYHGHGTRLLHVAYAYAAPASYHRNHTVALCRAVTSTAGYRYYKLWPCGAHNSCFAVQSGGLDVFKNACAVAERSRRRPARR